MLLAAVAKLLIIVPNQAPAVISYPTVERCEAAKRALLKASAETPEQEAADRRLAEQIGRPVVRERITAYCIPG